MVLLYTERLRSDKKVKVCFLTAGEEDYGAYSDIFSSLSANCFIRKPIENEELMKRINKIIVESIPLYGFEVTDMRILIK
jgi:DNA-binding response OmpR family regulator